MFSFEESKSNIGKLVEDFDNKIKIIKTDKYKEANVEDEFIKPLFKYLNWNISNEGIKNIANREFIVQAKGKGGKEPDYLLQLEGKPCFYMEAKHPKYNLFKELKFIWQAYAYAYSTQASSERKKVNFALLTDFEEFRFFDCTFKAEPKTVNNYTVLDWKYSDYVDKFKDLWEFFERENVRTGSLNALFINEKQKKENRIPPDIAFLSDIDDEKKGWRILLAHDIKKFNPNLSPEFITTVIQIIIDRFVFIKVLSDREIEDDFLTQIIEQIDKASLRSDEGKINDICNDLFARMNKTYNGSIFERRTELDMVTLSNKTLHMILKSLLPENSRYNFKVIPVEILGTIYEQFLGKIAVTTAKQVKIDEKPGVRKAGGVYYTPQYIVEYIVENAVGAFLAKCKTIAQLMDIKICDPACGSGSFLLGAYDRLISWVVEYFYAKINSEKEIAKKERELFYQDNDGNIRLTAKLKRDILKSCIYGVDIDLQAVEVTKMSLSLKALEDTQHDELYNEVDLFHEAVLPDLSANIKCGNSLIGSDFYAEKDLSLFGAEEMRKVNVFDWDGKDGFPAIMKAGGFDCVIGNPPYVRQELLKEYKNYFQKTYNTYHGVADLYVYFIEKSINLIKNAGFYSIIVANKWMRTNYGEPLRMFLKTIGLKRIIDFGDLPVFRDATTYPCIIVIEKNQNNEIIQATEIKDLDFTNLNDYVTEQSFPLIMASLQNDNWSLKNKATFELLEKIKRNGIPIMNYVSGKIYRGIITGLNEAFVIDDETRRKLIADDPKSEEIIKPFLAGKEVKRYCSVECNHYLIFIPNQKLLYSFQTESEKKILQQKADIIDKQIDALVYKLYDLTDEEIKIVEGN